MLFLGYVSPTVLCLQILYDCSVLYSDFFHVLLARISRIYDLCPFVKLNWKGMREDAKVSEALSYPEYSYKAKQFFLTPCFFVCLFKL
jgi:hypothetical protein